MSGVSDLQKFWSQITLCSTISTFEVKGNWRAGWWSSDRPGTAVDLAALESNFLDHPDAGTIPSGTLSV